MASHTDKDGIGPPPRTEPITLMQRAFLCGKKELRMDGELVACSERTLFGKSQHSVELGSLDPNPRRRGSCRWTFAVLALVSAAVAATFLAIGLHQPGAEILVIMSLLTMPAPIIFLAIALGGHEVVIFETSFPRAPAIQLLASKPDRETADCFVEELGRRIEAAKKHMMESLGAVGVAGHIRELIKLRAEGLITESEFRAAKAKILGLESWQVE